jgi:hypothetical protein
MLLVIVPNSVHARDQASRVLILSLGRFSTHEKKFSMIKFADVRQKYNPSLLQCTAQQDTHTH